MWFNVLQLMGWICIEIRDIRPRVRSKGLQISLSFEERMADQIVIQLL